MALPTPSEDDYTIGEVIGKGSFGEVRCATVKATGDRVVLKNIDLAALSESELNSSAQEVYDWCVYLHAVYQCLIECVNESQTEVLAHMNHPHIVKYYQSFVHRDSVVCIVMEYCEGGDLQQLLRSRAGEPFPEDEAVGMVAQIALALQYCHTRRILHRDLKPSNVYLTKTGLLKLGDFGMARTLGKTSDLANTVVCFVSSQSFRCFGH
jgi:NIMA (never in mitosis gene a)-related kinase